jgi:Skp family chaperone for outer membrane proteins
MQRQFIGATIAAIILILGFTGLAQAQTFLVMNEQRILRESAVGLHIATEMGRIGQEIEAELAPLSAQLAQENEALTAETSVLSEEALRQRPDLITRLQTLQADAQRFELLRRQRAQEIQATERAAMQPVLQALQAVLQEIVEERQATILIDRSQVVFAAESIDITDAAIARLNEVIPTTPVNRVRLPDPAEQAAQPQ